MMGHDGKPVETVNPQVSACPEPAEGTGHLRSDLLKGPRSRGNLGAESDSRSDLPPGIRDLIDQLGDAEHKLSQVRFALASLTGYYQRDGAIPIEAIEDLLSERWPS